MIGRETELKEMDVFRHNLMRRFQIILRFCKKTPIDRVYRVKSTSLMLGGLLEPILNPCILYRPTPKRQIVDGLGCTRQKTVMFSGEEKFLKYSESDTQSDFVYQKDHLYHKYFHNGRLNTL